MDTKETLWEASMLTDQCYLKSGGSVFQLYLVTLYTLYCFNYYYNALCDLTRNNNYYISRVDLFRFSLRGAFLTMV